ALARRFAGTLSGGQKQRLALAAVTLHEPELLFLDEPTSAVDPQSRRDFWDTLFELCEQGVTILVSTHYMDEAERCHALAVLDRGQLVADGTPQVLQQGIDAQVVELESTDPRKIRGRLESLEAVRSVTQLGMRLRVHVRRDEDDPLGLIQSALANVASITESRLTHPNLEDVFVAATKIASPEEFE
ncbi:MAG: ATP-binding cassette domain-containing protein, partial [Arenimonas sp.]